MNKQNIVKVGIGLLVAFSLGLILHIASASSDYKDAMEQLTVSSDAVRKAQKEADKANFSACLVRELVRLEKLKEFTMERMELKDTGNKNLNAIIKIKDSLSSENCVSPESPLEQPSN